MENRLYIGNLAYATTEDEMRTLFAQAGAVKSVTIIREPGTGRSKGFGFVEMETEEQAQQAIKLFNGTSLGNRTINVNVARPRQDRPKRRDFSGGQRTQASRTRPDRFQEEDDSNE